MQFLPPIAILGGTGHLGLAIARRLAQAGCEVILGSREGERAAAAAAGLGIAGVRGATNAEAARAADIAVLTVPHASQAATLESVRKELAGKVLIDTTVPLVPPKVMRVQLPAAGSAAVAAQQLLGPEVKVVSAFHNVAAHRLATDEDVDCDVLVFGDDKTARALAVRLVEACRLRGLHGGPLANSAAAEALTSVLIFINRTYSVDGAGLRITGRLEPPSG